MTTPKQAANPVVKVPIVYGSVAIELDVLIGRVTHNDPQYQKLQANFNRLMRDLSTLADKVMRETAKAKNSQERLAAITQKYEGQIEAVNDRVKRSVAERINYVAPAWDLTEDNAMWPVSIQNLMTLPQDFLVHIMLEIENKALLGLQWRNN